MFIWCTAEYFLAEKEHYGLIVGFFIKLWKPKTLFLKTLHSYITTDQMKPNFIFIKIVEEEKFENKPFSNCF